MESLQNGPCISEPMDVRMRTVYRRVGWHDVHQDNVAQIDIGRAGSRGPETTRGMQEQVSEHMGKNDGDETASK